MTSRQIIFAAIFWGCFAGVLYSYALYALVIRICAGLFGRDSNPPALPDDKLPSVSLLIAAYNESEVIEQRIESALETNYPSDRLEIVIASDGSHDNTSEIVRKYASRGVNLLDYPINRGKASVLNDSIPELSGRIVVLSDANTLFEPDAIRSLVRWFESDDIGAVCGRLILTDPVKGNNADGLYWKYETFLKKNENRLGALLGSNGAIYAVRRDRYVPIPADTIVDDFVIPLLVRLRWNCKCVYDSQAIAHERTPADLSSEFHRRARIGAGGYQSIFLLWKLLNPANGWIVLSFVSHKLLRWLCPFLMLAMIATNLALIDRKPYRNLLLLQAAFYVVAVTAGLMPRGGKILKPARLAAMFVSMNAALLVGFFRWIMGRQRGAWKRTSRAAEMLRAEAQSKAIA